MKQLISNFIIICVLLGNTAFAAEEVYLDFNTRDIRHLDTGTLRYENIKSDDDEDENYLKPSFQTIKNMFDEDFGRAEKNKSRSEN